jgi:hypothetical protein
MQMIEASQQCEVQQSSKKQKKEKWAVAEPEEISYTGWFVTAYYDSEEAALKAVAKKGSRYCKYEKNMGMEIGDMLCSS